EHPEDSLMPVAPVRGRCQNAAAALAAGARAAADRIAKLPRREMASRQWESAASPRSAEARTGVRGGDGGRRRPRERRGRPALIAAATALALLLVPAAAPAAPTWLAPQRVSAPGQESVGPTVAMDAAGGVVAAWLHSGGIFNDHVEASFRAAGPGQSFTAPQVISGKGSLIGIVPEVAVDPQGNA